MMHLRERLKWLLFPGSNLHARLRYAVLPPFFESARPGETRLVLDAGCGNGMLSYASCCKGNRVVGLSIKQDEVERNRKLFNVFLRIPEDRLTFRAKNLYELELLGMRFDEIICSEVLEHIVRDADVCRIFANVLKPDGILHLCCPNADHPDNAGGPLDPGETGGHVRPGYTLASYKTLLDPLGFRITQSAGLGGPIRQAFNRRIIRIEEQFGAAPGFALSLIALPVLWLDPAEPRMPYSIYVRAVKTS